MGHALAEGERVTAEPEHWKPAPAAPRFQIHYGADTRLPGEPNRPLRPKGAGFALYYRFDIPEGNSDAVNDGPKGRRSGGNMIDTPEAFRNAIRASRKFYIVANGEELILTNGQIVSMRITPNLLHTLGAKGYVYADGSSRYGIDYDALEGDFP